MTPEVERLLEAAAALSPDRRAEFLNRECPDPAVRADVESLLEYAGASEGFFAGAVGAVAASLPSSADLSSADLSSGDRLGPYRIVSFLGRGGMGSVYLADRADGAFEQKVAVKVAQTRHAVFLAERFRQERRILALLHHPNIARILDGGQTPDGSPYFVMEYVEGEPLDRFCERRGLPLRARLELFLKVCDAVRHAHQHLIVHRDLKPANIFVTADGEPKLLDFGIAKIVDPTQPDNASTRLLTPEYASPEQMRGDPVTTFSDIYSLGAVLYKLLAGRPPHLVEAMSPLEVARAIAEEEVVPASATHAAVPRDVDAILGKALHKDAARRYHSVEELAADLGRYLQGRPVLAAPDSFFYRASRFVARHAWGVSAGAVVSLLLLASTAVSIHHARRAETRFQQVRQLANVFLFDFERSIQDLPGALDARRLVASTAKRYLEQLSAEAGGDPGLQREIAEAYERLGDILDRLQSEGGTEASIQSYRRAYEIHQSLGAEGGGRARIVRSASTLANRYHMYKNAAEAARWDQEAARIAREWVSAEPRSVAALDAAQLAFRARGMRLEVAGRATEARESHEQAVRFAEQANAIGSPDRHTVVNLATDEYILSNLLLNLKKAPEALEHAGRALSLASQLHETDAANPQWNRLYQMALSSNGIAHRALAATDSTHLSLAVQYLQRAHALADEAVRADPKDARAKDNFIAQCHRLAKAQIDARQHERAAALYEQAGRTARELTATDPRSRRAWYLLAKNQVDYGLMRLRQNRLDQARQLLASADPAFASGFALDPLDTVLLEVRATQLEKLAEAAEKAGDRSRARHEINRCLDVLAGAVHRDPAGRDYFGEYQEMLALARKLGVSTRDLQ